MTDREKLKLARLLVSEVQEFAVTYEQVHGVDGLMMDGLLQRSSVGEDAYNAKEMCGVLLGWMIEER